MKSSPGCCPAAPTPAQAAGIERRSSCHGCGARPEARHKAGRAGCACPGTAARTKKEPSRPGLCRGFPPPAAGSGPPFAGAAPARPVPFRPPRCGGVPCRRAALRPRRGARPRRGRPSCAACRSARAAGCALRCSPLPVSARPAWRPVLPGPPSWVACGSARYAVARRRPALPAPAPRARPLGCGRLCRPCRAGAPPPGARRARPAGRALFILGGLPCGGGLRATGARGYARPARGGTRPHPQDVIKGENLCKPGTRCI